jgi:hypothetical protein
VIKSHRIYLVEMMFDTKALARGRKRADRETGRFCLGPAILPEHLHAQRRAVIAQTHDCARPFPHTVSYIDMSDKPGIPSWQRVSADSTAASPPEQDQQPETSIQSEHSTSAIAEAPTPTEDDLDNSESTSLLEQAKRFLDDATIRDAPREKKVTFLESKGVSADDIGTLLGTESQEKNHVGLEEAGERAWSTVRARGSYLIALVFSWMAFY